MILSGQNANFEHYISHWMRDRVFQQGGLMQALRSLSPVRPFANPDEENSDPFLRVIRRHHWRIGQIGSPFFRRVSRNKKHHVWMPALVTVV